MDKNFYKDLNIPVIAAPLFLISGPKLVIECCKNGIVGTFPALNQRTSEGFEEWVIQIKDELADYEKKTGIKPAHGKVIIAVLDGQMTVKRLYKRSGKIILMPENDLYKPIEIEDHMNMEIWGVVTSSVHFL